MLGMFIILPVFAPYASNLSGGDSQTLIGIALGVYGLTQACFQVPLGRLSDVWGRKRTIYIGLLVFAAGSLVAAMANDIYSVAIGRAIQGAGAIASALIALNADLTSDHNRTKSMAIIGISIGATFIVSMVAGPALARWVGVPGIFAMTGFLAVAAIAVVRFVVPEPLDDAAAKRDRPATAVRELLRDRELVRLNFGIFSLHGMLMAMFVAVPFDGPEELTDDVFDRVRQVLRDNQDEPLVLHCGRANRVGAVWMVHRVLDDGVGIDKALEEAKAVGLRTPEYIERAQAYIQQAQAPAEDAAAAAASP